MDSTSIFKEETPAARTDNVLNSTMISVSVLWEKKDTVPLENWDGPAEASEDIAGYHALVDSFTRLLQTYRAIMEIKLLSGYSDREIAAKLNLSKTAVSTRISRGRQLLRDIMEA